MELKSIPIGSLRSEVLIVNEDLPISKLIGKLSNTKRYEAFTFSNGKFQIVGLRDILNASDILGEKVSSLSWTIPHLNSSSSLAEASELMMRFRVKAIPLLDEGRVAGEVSSSSILLEGRKMGLFNFPISRLMTVNVINVQTADSLSKARKNMVENQIDHLPVLQDVTLKGILTSEDIISYMVPKASPRRGMMISEAIRQFQYKVGGIMSRSPLTSNPDDAGSTILDRMMKRRLDYSIITFGHEIQGIVTYRDFLRILTTDKVSEPPIYMIGLPEDLFEAEAAKSKFSNAIRSLAKGFPNILEARTTIKQSRKRPVKERRRYEVDVSIKTDDGLLSFHESGWDLPTIYDVLSDRIKRILTKKISRRR